MRKDLSNDDRDFEKLRARLHDRIPGGAHTYSRGDDQFPIIAPPLLSHGKGAYVWDTQGNQYLDYGMALRSVTIGFADERVNAAAIREIERGVNMTRASLTELRAAELLCDIVDGADMVKFGKNGSNVTTAAVKVARSCTGRRYVCVPRQHPFFSYDDWFIGTTAIKKGVLMQASASTLVFDYGDMASLETLFAEHPGEIAAVMLEPATQLTPCGLSACMTNWPEKPCHDSSEHGANFLQKVRELTTREGALMILDEMITGFRWNLKGAQHFFGVTPDLTTFGKAMANGFSLAALVGKREYMEVGAIDRPGMERTFLLSSTHGAEMPALGAFMEATRINRDEDVTGHLWSYGKKFVAIWNDATQRHGMSDYLQLDGPPIALNYLIRGVDGELSMPMRTLFAQEMLKGGVLLSGLSFAQSHGDDELELTARALENALPVCKAALHQGVETFLVGPAVKPVFRQHN